jgi:hypothetical protein
MTVCRNCRGAIEQRTTPILGWVRWVHTGSGEEFCSLYFGIAAASPLTIEGVGEPTPQERETP